MRRAQTLDPQCSSLSNDEYAAMMNTQGAGAGRLVKLEGRVGQILRDGQQGNVEFLLLNNGSGSCPIHICYIKDTRLPDEGQDKKETGGTSMKRAAGIVLCLIMLLSVLPAKGLEAPAAQNMGFEYALMEDATATITRYIGNETELWIPAVLDGHPVTGIGENAFRDHGNLIRAVIPEGVTVIGELALYNCQSLSALDLPGGLKEIHGFAFAYCTSLRSVSIPEGVMSIGKSAFEGCESLMQAVLPESVTSIGPDTFYVVHANFRLLCAEGSYAQAYAVGNGISFGLPSSREASADIREAGPGTVDALGMDMTLRVPSGGRRGAYTGATLDGLPHGEGTFVSFSDERGRWTYTGSWENGSMQGSGSAIWDNGWEMRGEYRQNLLTEGQALYDGTVLYDGEFQWSGAAEDSLYHGKGTLYNALSRRIFEGRFENGCLAESEAERAARASLLAPQCRDLTASDYATFLKSEGDWMGKLVRLSGTVDTIWRADDFGYAEFELALGGDAEDPVLVRYRYGTDEPRATLNSEVTLLGTVIGIDRFAKDDAAAIPIVEADVMLPSAPRLVETIAEAQDLNGLWIMTTTYLSYHYKDGVELEWNHTWSVPVQVRFRPDSTGTWSETFSWGTLAGTATYADWAISASLYGNGPVEYRGTVGGSRETPIIRGSMTEESHTDVSMWAKGTWEAERLADEQTFAAYRELRVGSKGPDVAALKQQMFELGYFRTNTVNESFTENTAESVREFEKANGLPEDGIADPVMQALFFSQRAIPKPR